MGSYFLKGLSTNHTVIVFDNRGIGSTTIGSKNFTIDQFAIDSAGLLDSIEISKSDIRIFYGWNNCSAINIDIEDASNQKTKSIITRIETLFLLAILIR